MILKSRNFGNKPTILTDLRDFEQEFSPKITAECQSYQLNELTELKNKLYKIGKYQINPNQLTCTCNYHQEISQTYSGYDIRKVCFHIYNYLEKTNFRGITDLSRILLEKQKQFGPFCTLKVNDQFYITFSPSEYWINLYLSGNNNWSQYAYNIEEKRWARNRKPKNENEILSTINEEFNTQ